MTLRSAFLALFLGGLAQGCQPSVRCPDSAAAGRENILIIVSDDIGVDKTAAYGHRDTAPATPHIDELAEQGLLFRNFYAMPTCSPTRSALMTGRLPSRNGVGRWIAANNDAYGLPLYELTIPEMLRHSDTCYTTGMSGKWHMVDFNREDPQDHPNLQGFDHHGGTLANPQEAVRDDDSKHADRSYFDWEKNTDGDLSWSSTYIPIDTTDDALAFIQNAPEPWFLVVSYNLAHVPVHVPPDDLNLTGVTEDSTDLEKYEAMVSAMDAEMGRLLSAIPDGTLDRTNLFYMSDNGTDPQWIVPPWTPGRGKGTVYDGGVRVPLIALGPHVATPGGETDALVSVTDFFPTIAELAGVDVASLDVEQGHAAGAPIVLDGASFLSVLEEPDGPPIRDLLYSEGFYPNGDLPQDWHERAIRDAGWKLIRQEANGQVVSDSLFRYKPDYVDEGWNLIAQEPDEADVIEARDRLMQAMDDEVDRLTYGY